MVVLFDSNIPALIDSVSEKLVKPTISWCDSECDCKTLQLNNDGSSRKKEDDVELIYLKTPIALCDPNKLVANSTHFIVLCDGNDPNLRTNVTKRLFTYLSDVDGLLSKLNVDVILITNNVNLAYKSCKYIYYLSNNNACTNIELWSNFTHTLINAYCFRKLYPHILFVIEYFKKYGGVKRIYDEKLKFKEADVRRMAIDLYRLSY